MVMDNSKRPTFVIGPDGLPIALSDLPPADTERWVVRRKAQVVAAVRGGLITLEEACERYRLSVEEFLSWQRLIDRHGMAGLRVTRTQKYRQPGEKDSGSSSPATAMAAAAAPLTVR